MARTGPALGGTPAPLLVVPGVVLVARGALCGGGVHVVAGRCGLNYLIVGGVVVVLAIGFAIARLLVDIAMVEERKDEERKP